MELAEPDNEKQPMTGHFGQTSGLAKSRFLLIQHCRIKTIFTNSIFLLFLEVKK